MSFQVRYTKCAKDDLQRLFHFLLNHDLGIARQAREAVSKSMEFLKDFPFSCRKVAADNPFLRELLIPFGQSGYIVLFEIEDKATVTVLAVRHQYEEDYH